MRCDDLKAINLHPTEDEEASWVKKPKKHNTLLPLSSMRFIVDVAENKCFFHQYDTAAFPTARCQQVACHYTNS